VTRSPSPLSIGSDFARAVESKFERFESFSHDLSLYDILSKAAAWEDRVLRYGGEQLHAIEDILDVLKNITKHNIHNIDDGLSSLSRQFSNLRAKSSLAQSQLSNLTAVAKEDLHHLESFVYESLTSLVDVTWPVHRWPIHVFTTGAMVCLLTSSMCHLFGCCSKHIAMLMWQFDYAGIAVLIVASFFPPVYYGFLCHPIYVVTYLGIVSICGMATIAITLMPTFQAPHYHAFRAATFTSLGLFGIIPTLHAWSLHRNVSDVHEALVLDLWMGAIYLLGTGVYTLKVPERFWPGRFDVAFHSHQLFHIAVVAAAMVHYRACGVLVAWRDTTGFCLN
jgi:adiponectin receptor